MHDDRQSVTEILNAWAEDVIRVEAERDEARAERDQIRELLSVAIEKLHHAHKREQLYRERLADLTDTVRDYRIAA